MKKILFLSLIAIFLNLFLFIPKKTMAGSCGTTGFYPDYSCIENPNDNYNCAPGIKDNLGNDRCDSSTQQCCILKSAGSTDSKTILQNPLGSGISVKSLIVRIIKVILGLVGALAVAFFIYGGLIWMTAGGSPDKIKKGRDILTWTILGLVIIFTSYIILNFVFKSLEQVTK